MKPSWEKILSTEENTLKLTQIKSEKPKWKRYTLRKEKGKITSCFSIKFSFKEKHIKKIVKKTTVYRKSVLIINSVSLFY